MRYLLLLSTLLASALAPSTAAQGFVERSEALGLEHRFMSGLDRIGDLPNMHDWVQVGMAPADVDGDADLDLVMLGRVAPNHLWSNVGGGFIDATPGSGLLSTELDTCASFADWDADGDLDLAIGVYDRGELALPGNGRLLRNDGTGVFEDVTVLAGRLGNGHTLSIQMADIDLDGWTDMYLSEFGGTVNQLWRNLGAGAFVERAAAVGADVAGSPHVSGILDTDGDGRPEIHIGNDWPVSFSAGMESQLGEVLLSAGEDGTFTDVTSGSGLEENLSTMAIAWGDVDYDGDPDGYKTQVGTQYLIVNQGWPASGAAWTREEYEYGIDAPYVKNPFDPFGYDFGQTVGWGAHFTALDLDPWADLYMVCGHVEPQASDKNEKNFLFLGTGPGFGHIFWDATLEVGIKDHYDDRALLCADPDSDGDVDLLVGPPGGTLRYFENRMPRLGRGFLVVVPHGSTSAPAAVGTRVRWIDKLGLSHTRWPGAEAMTAGQNERAAFFGLGAEQTVDLEVNFPSGLTRLLPGVAKNTRLDVVEPPLIELSIADGVMTPGEMVTVTGYAHDELGTPLDAGATVALRVPGMRPLGPVTHVGGNTFQRTFRAVSPGDYGVRASFGSFDVRVRPRITVRGALDAGMTTARCVPEAVRAGGADVTRFEVAPRDAQGLPLGSGHAVSARLGGAPPVMLADLGDGRYAGTLAAPAAPGLYEVTVRVDDTSLGSVAALDVAGAPEPALTSLYEETPEHHIAMNPTLWFGLLTPRDGQGLRLGPGADVTVQITTNPGSVPVTLRADLAPAGQPDGQFVLVLERAPASHPDDASGTLTVFVDGVAVAVRDFLF